MPSTCPACGQTVPNNAQHRRQEQQNNVNLPETKTAAAPDSPRKYRNPVPTVDIIINYGKGIILIKRRNPPHGWALPGGFVDYGESLETAAAREAKEETGLEVSQLRQFHAYSDPSRDTRQHTISVVFSAQGHGKLMAGDDAAEAQVFQPNNLPPLAFDHEQIIKDFFR